MPLPSNIALSFICSIVITSVVLTVSARMFIQAIRKKPTSSSGMTGGENSGGSSGGGGGPVSPTGPTQESGGPSNNDAPSDAPSYEEKAQQIYDIVNRMKNDLEKYDDPDFGEIAKEDYLFYNDLEDVAFEEDRYDISFPNLDDFFDDETWFETSHD